MLHCTRHCTSTLYQHCTALYYTELALTSTLYQHCTTLGQWYTVQDTVPVHCTNTVLHCTTLEQCYTVQDTVPEHCTNTVLHWDSGTLYQHCTSTLYQHCTTLEQWYTVQDTVPEHPNTWSHTTSTGATLYQSFMKIPWNCPETAIPHHGQFHCQYFRIPCSVYRIAGHGLCWIDVLTPCHWACHK